MFSGNIILRSETQNTFKYLMIGQCKKRYSCSALEFCTLICMVLGDNLYQLRLITLQYSSEGGGGFQLSSLTNTNTNTNSNSNSNSLIISLMAAQFNGHVMFPFNSINSINSINSTVSLYQSSTSPFAPDNTFSLSAVDSIKILSVQIPIPIPIPTMTESLTSVGTGPPTSSLTIRP